VYGGVLFAAAYSEALIAARGKFGPDGLMLFSYFDDTYAHLPTDMVNSFLSFFKAELHKLGLELNDDKSEIWLPSGPLADTIAPTITKRDLGGVEVCGTPVGTPDYVRQFMLKKVDEYTKLHERTRAMEDTQAQYLTLRYATCCNLNHWVRTVPPEQMREHAALFDKECLDTLRHMLDVPTIDGDDLTEDEIIQCRLHVKLGGLGLTSAEAVMEAAYVGSWGLTKTLINEILKPLAALPGNLPEILNHVTTRATEANSLRHLKESHETLEEQFITAGKEIQDLDKLELIKEKGQRTMYAAVLANMQEASLASGSLSDRVRKLSCSGKHAGAWLNAIPKYYAFRLEAEQMKTALRLRLGLEHPAIFTDVRCAGCQEHTVDAQGVHSLTCTKGGNDLWLRHEGLVHATHDATRTCQKFSRIKELHGILPDRRMPDGRMAELVPDQLVERMGPGGKDLLTDTSVICPVAATYLQIGRTALGAAKKRETTKDATYLQPSQSIGKDFIPLVFETYGAWGPGVQKFFTQLKNIMKNKLPQDTAHTWTSDSWASYHAQKISIALQRGNADTLLRRARRDFRATHTQDGCLPPGHRSGDGHG
jgi:hypothetical protein